MKIFFNQQEKTLINLDSGHILYRERHNGKVDIMEILGGEKTWNDLRNIGLTSKDLRLGKTNWKLTDEQFTIEDFIREILDIDDFEFVESPHECQALRFSADELQLLTKISLDAQENKRGIGAQIKYICEQYYRKEDLNGNY